MQSPPDAERYALALESINENLYDWDIENDTVYFAPGLFKILGLKAEHMRRPSDWTDRIHPDDRPLFKYTLAEHLKGKTPRFSMELRYRDGSGNWRWARQAGIALRRPDGYAYRMVGAAGDITETKHLDEALVASADVLKVMSRATFELQTVLDAVVQAAVRLCEADAALIFRREGDHYRLAAEKGLSPKQREFLRDEKIPLTRKTMVGRTALERRVIHVPDITADTEYDWPEVHQVADFRTIVGVPLMRDGEPVGVITLTRSVGRAVQRQTDRADLHLRRSGGDRDRDRAAVRAGAGAQARNRAHAQYPRHHDRQHGRRHRADDAGGRRRARAFRQQPDDGVPELSGGRGVSREAC